MNNRTCSSCGATSMNPAAASCQYCGAVLPMAGQPAAYGAPQYGPPVQQAYGPPMQQQGYGPPNAYGAPMQQYHQPYGQQPGHFGQPYGYPQPNHQVQHSAGGIGNALASTWNIFWLIRLGIALVVISLGLIGACVSAIAH